MNESIKKNILDLNFQKYLITASTSIIIGFTYLIGIGIAFMTKQINFSSTIHLMILFIFSGIILGLCAFFFFKSLHHIKNILTILKELR